MERVEIVFDPQLGEDVVFRNAWLPSFQARRAGKRWFCANASGDWTFLDDAEYEAARSVALPRSLFDRLESALLILTAANASTHFDRHQQWSGAHFRHPSLHIVVATTRCNLACSYCHVDVVPPDAGSGFDLSQPVADAIVEFALNSPAPTLAFEFQGGESLLNGEVLRYMIPMIQRACAVEDRKAEISIQTNGTLLNPRWMELFQQHGVTLGTSIDGPPELHDAQRRRWNGSGSYDAVARNAERFDVPMLPTVTRLSLPYWQEIVDRQLAGGAQSITFQNVYPINAAARNWEQVGLEMDEFLACYDLVVQYLRSRWRSGYYPLERRFRLALEKLARRRDVGYPDFANPCGMAHGQIAYHTNGDVYTCDEGRDFPEFRLGNVLTSSYDEVVFGPTLRRLKSLSIPNDTECLSCAYRPVCSTCPVYDRAVTGELTARHAGTAKCRQTKYIFDTLIGW
ncbi:MAG TPA: radical SAM protein, partial [Thermoanaerobaculia bacterium]|nr:radical SAM protein [Thermoanaerobaculia bacterium]